MTTHAVNFSQLLKDATEAVRVERATDRRTRDEIELSLDEYVSRSGRHWNIKRLDPAGLQVEMDGHIDLTIEAFGGGNVKITKRGTDEPLRGGGSRWALETIADIYVRRERTI